MLKYKLKAIQFTILDMFFTKSLLELNPAVSNYLEDLVDSKGHYKDDMGHSGTGPNGTSNEMIYNLFINASSFNIIKVICNDMYKLELDTPSLRKLADALQWVNGEKDLDGIFTVYELNNAFKLKPSIIKDPDKAKKLKRDLIILKLPFVGFVIGAISTYNNHLKMIYNARYNLWWHVTPFTGLLHRLHEDGLISDLSDYDKTWAKGCDNEHLTRCIRKVENDVRLLYSVDPEALNMSKDLIDYMTKLKKDNYK